MKPDIRLRALSLGVIIYIMAAVLWWSVLLYRKNQDVFHSQLEWQYRDALAKQLVASKAEFFQSDLYVAIRKRYTRQNTMIVGESVVFFLSLLMGIWFINRGYWNEVNASRQRRNFLLSITHELKSPLAGIQLALETHLKRELTREQSTRLLDNALRETQRLKNLVNDLLLSAKLDTAYQLHPEPIDWKTFLEEITAQFQGKYPQAQLTLDVDDGLPAYSGDRSGLTSVVLNLLENAVKYSPEPACIRVRLARTEAGVRLEVADQGIGIPERERAKVFARFYRIGNEETRRTKGTGLGLYIVYQMVKVHGGHIAILDNQPKGTIFRIDLPWPKS